MNGWYIFKCHCHKWSVQELRIQTWADAKFKCKYCGKTTKLKQKKTWGLVLDHKGPFSLPAEATKACQEANGGRNHG